MNTLSQENFERLLCWLCPDSERAGNEYVRIRNDLIKYFSSMLAWTVADDLADQCLDRVAKKVGSLPPYWADKLPYCKAVARYIYLEYIKSHAFLTESVEDEELERERQHLNPVSFNQEIESEQAREKDQMLECQERCLQNLPEGERALIETYYRADDPEETRKKVETGGHIDARKKLAERLGMSRNTLRVRLHRIRVTLRQCIEECLQQKGREWNE
jgi:RNA polymerase sigma factor (sigma-70 family)